MDIQDGRFWDEPITLFNFLFSKIPTSIHIRGIKRQVDMQWHKVLQHQNEAIFVNLKIKSVLSYLTGHWPKQSVDSMSKLKEHFDNYPAQCDGLLMHEVTNKLLNIR